MTTADKLRLLRQQRKLTQAVAARAIGIPLGTYVRYECGGKAYDRETITRIAKFFDVEESWLFGEESAEPVCAWCGNPMPEDIQSLRNIYCNDECRRLAANFKRRQEREEAKRYCLICGERVPPGSRQKYCSDECLRKSKLKNKGRTKNARATDWNPKTESYADYQRRTSASYYRGIYIAPGRS